MRHNIQFFFLITYCFVFVFSSGCAKKDVQEGPFRINLKPAGKGAPDFSKEPLITEDNVNQEIHIDVDWEGIKNETAEKITQKAWAALGARAFQDAIKLADICIEKFEGVAKSQQDSLKGIFPKAGDELKYKELNAVGAAYYIKAESYQKMGDCANAKINYRNAINKFPLSQNWDPRGWFWSIKEESQSKLEALEQECNNGK